MKLRSLYCNLPDKFGPVVFRDGLNVVLGSVTRPKAREHDTHNLGKSLLAQLIDFCLLRQKSGSFFLFKHDAFEPFVFFLELETHSGHRLTIRRSVLEGSKASFRYDHAANIDFVDMPQDAWQHWNLPFEKAREVLDAYLDLQTLRPWDYRRAIAYALRGQKDYDEPFHLSKFAGSHSEWKPFLARMLGLDSTLVQRGYEIAERIQELEAAERHHKETAGGIDTPDQLRGLIEIAEREVTGLTHEVDAFNLAPAEERETRRLVEQIDQSIAALNEERYGLQTERARIAAALDQRLSVDVKALSSIFEQAKIYFGDQVKRDYAALERFNRELVEERDGYLREELGDLTARLTEVELDLARFNEERTESLRTLSDAASMLAYKRITKRLAVRQGELEVLRVRNQSVEELQRVRTEVRRLELERSEVHEQLEHAVANTQGVYLEIRRYFDDVVSRVIGQHGNLFTEVNKEGNPNFRADILDPEGRSTSAGEGFSYGRLLCIAFDMAVARAYVSKPFPHFIYHDGFLETLDDRKKRNLIDTVRAYTAFGYQQIVTVIESELPIVPETGKRFSFDEREIVLRLSDAGDSGRLFRLPAW